MLHRKVILAWIERKHGIRQDYELWIVKKEKGNSAISKESEFICLAVHWVLSKTKFGRNNGKRPLSFIVFAKGDFKKQNSVEQERKGNFVRISASSIFGFRQRGQGSRRQKTERVSQSLAKLLLISYPRTWSITHTFLSGSLSLWSFYCFSCRPHRD